MPVRREDVLAAADRIRGRVHRTPTFSSHTLSHTLGERVWLKAELFQKTGSFKARGVLNKLASLSAEEKARGVIGISAGNHAQALAWGAAAEGIDCLVVMYASASAAKVAATRGYGASIDLEAADAVEAFARLDEHIRETGRTLVHPFDDPLVIAVPAFLIATVLGYLLLVIWFLGWFAALATGRMPPGFRDAGAAAIRYTAQTYAYALLLTSRYPHSSPALPARPEPEPFLPPFAPPTPEPGAAA